jgi:hypothetical protein
VPIVLKSGSLNLLETSGNFQAYDGIVSPLPLKRVTINIYILIYDCFKIFIQGSSIYTERTDFRVLWKVKVQFVSCSVGKDCRIGKSVGLEVETDLTKEQKHFVNILSTSFCRGSKLADISLSFTSGMLPDTCDVTIK